MNIILIISDTLRQDHLGIYGNDKIRTPNLDSFAKKSAIFDRCFVGSYPTLPNRGDLITGKYNFAYLGWAPLPMNEITLAGLLTRAGYLTAGIADTPFYMRHGYGYDRGFDDFIFIRGQNAGPARDDVLSLRRLEEDLYAPQTMATAERWLEQHYQDGPFFLLIDTWDPHEPWEAPDYYVQHYVEDFKGEPSPWPPYWEWQEAGLTQEDVDLAHAHYCGEVTMVDRWVGRVLERADSLNIMDDTAILFTSDHGFYFGEHGILGKGRFKSKYGYRVGPDLAHRGEYKHAFMNPETGEITISEAEWYRSPLFKEITQVPLLAWIPGLAPQRLDALVTLTDIMPTIMDLAGLEIPAQVQTPSLLPLLKNEIESIHDFIVTSWPLYQPGQELRVVDDIDRPTAQTLPSSITDGEWTLIYATAAEKVELYHDLTDPGQEMDVVAENEEVARDLHHRFVKFLEDIGTREELLSPRREFQNR
jgi:arylsulfatase A-like enzyme